MKPSGGSAPSKRFNSEMFSMRSIELRMRVWILLLLMLALLVPLSPPVRGEERPGGAGGFERNVPLAVVPETTQDLGDISTDREYECSFKVFNAGTGMLEVKEVIVG